MSDRKPVVRLGEGGPVVGRVTSQTLDGNNYVVEMEINEDLGELLTIRANIPSLSIEDYLG